MFENLKAFIRHGKQANDLKGKVPEYGSSFAHSVDLADQNGLDITLASNEQSIADFHPQHNDLQVQINDEETNNYNQAASQIVEQENLQKQKQKNAKYPGLENYEILESMGEGAFSVVYKAKHLPSGMLVAVKILRKFQMDQVQKQAVLKEATIMRQLNHENIVKFVEFIDSDTYYYIVQELAIGGEIFTAIVNYTYFSEDLARHVIVQVAEAVRYLHEEVGIVHRDIKPENLLFNPIDFKPSANPVAKLRKSDDPNLKKDEGEFIPGVGGGTIGQVKLADFGLSKQIWEHNTKTPCGTVGYTAPEIVRDEKYSKEVDMWAIGCVLYTLLCGFPPFYDERIEQLTEKVARGEYTFLQPWWDEISSEAKYCVSKLLTVDPSRRYTIDDLLSDPWICKVQTQPIKKSGQKPIQHPIQGTTKFSKKFKGSELYSPAAVALRDAFDISTAVHRMGEEAALANRQKNIEDLVEEDEEEEEIDGQGHVLHSNQQPKINLHQNSRVFDLNLGGASILERRKNKPVSLRG